MKALSDKSPLTALSGVSNLFINKYSYSPFGASFRGAFSFLFLFFLSFLSLFFFLFLSSLRFFLFILFCLSRLAAHVSIHCPLSNSFYSLVPLSSYKAEILVIRKSISGCVQYTANSSRRASLGFLFFILLSELEFGKMPYYYYIAGL